MSHIYGHHGCTIWYSWSSSALPSLILIEKDSEDWTVLPVSTCTLQLIGVYKISTQKSTVGSIIFTFYAFSGDATSDVLTLRLPHPPQKLPPAAEAPGVVTGDGSLLASAGRAR